MRRQLALAALSALGFGLGCDIQPIGGRCEENTNCDTNTTTPSAFCATYANPNVQCTPGQDCICCPVDIATRNMVTLCRYSTPVDSGVVTPPDAGAPDAGTDTGPADAGPTCGDACVPGATYCTATGTCAPLLMIGQACGADTQCGTVHCVTGVCCNSACSGAGLSCNSDPNFAGLCMQVMQIAPDAGTPDAGTLDAGPPDAGAPDAALDAPAG